MASYFSRLNYSFGNEDYLTEQAALRIKPGDHVVCITGSGDRPLHLLLDEGARVTAVDGNQVQSDLLALKIAAMRQLPFDDYLSSLGGAPDGRRLEKLEAVINSLDDKTAHFWRANESMIKRGVLFEGWLERFFRFIVYPLTFFRRRVIRQLFSFDSLEDQREFVKTHWDRPWWRKIFEIIVSPRIIRVILGDPGIYNNLRVGANPGRFLYDKVIHALSHTLAKENYLLSLIFQGTVHQEAYPPYLTLQGVKVIVPKLDRLHIVTANIIDYLESVPPESVDGFSLSDVAGYLSAKEFARLIRAIHRAARHGARFSIRQVLTAQKFPDDLEKDFKRDHVLEKQLEGKDRCMIYHYMVGEVMKSPLTMDERPTSAPLSRASL